MPTSTPPATPVSGNGAGNQQNSSAMPAPAAGADGNQRRGIGRFVFNPWTVLVTLLLLATGIIIGSGAVGGNDQQERGGQAEQRAPAVETAKVVATELHQRVRGVGTLRTIQQVDLKPEQAGRLISVNFDEGGMVEQGQLLFELDGRKLQHQRASAQAALESAEARLLSERIRFRRARDLHERQAATDDELDQARADYDSAAADVRRLQAELSIIEEDIADTRIHAPFDGIISARRLDPGTYLTVGDVLATLYQIDPLEITFGVPERYTGRVRRGQPVELMVAAYPDEPFEGEVRYVSPSIERATRTFEVRARVANPDHRLKPGAFAAASVVIATREDRPVIPEEALIGTREGHMVFVVEEDEGSEPRAVARSVRIGLRQQDLIEIESGLEPGETIVRLGHMQVDDGDPVRVIEAHESGWLEDTAPAMEPPQG